MVPFLESLQQYTDAVARLDEALARPKDAFMRDSCIQRFEIAFDLAWKTLKSYLEDRLKVRCASPRACFREAQAQGIIAYDRDWLAIADDRNRTAHIYKEALADAVYVRLPDHAAHLRTLRTRLHAEVE